MPRGARGRSTEGTRAVAGRGDEATGSRFDALIGYHFPRMTKAPRAAEWRSNAAAPCRSAGNKKVRQRAVAFIGPPKYRLRFDVPWTVAAIFSGLVSAWILHPLAWITRSSCACMIPVSNALLA